MTYAAKLKRAAKYNPAWKDARIYEYALDEAGIPMVLDGAYQFDLKEISFGYLDRRPEKEFTISEIYQGSTVICVITENPPDSAHLIKLEDTFYEVKEIQASDALGATVSYIASAMETAPDIRTDTL